MKTAFLAGLKNWKTTAAACLAVVVACAQAGLALLDSDPATVPDWALIVTLVIAAAGLLFARDADITTADLRREGVLP